MKLKCNSHRPNADVFQPRCQRCGVPLLDREVSADQLVDRIELFIDHRVQLTGKQRGSWVEVAEQDAEGVWLWWARPAQNVAGFEAIEHPNPNPTGEELSLAFLAEMLTAPAAEPVVHEISTPQRRRKPSRWERAVARYRDWREASELREFVSLAAPLVCVELFAVCWILGSSGCAAVAQALWSLVS
ncbi:MULTISPECIES: hypothetical protein [unclassified Streptomyces]|uniref:hypothetical protein n=1 Tax=unclassified Streptomyces TaxID=2593676 RepID=UPI0036E050DF